MTEEELDLTKYKLTHKYSMEYIKSLLEFNPDLECVCAFHTCWWSIFKDEFMPYTSGRLPCDPLGSMLVQGTLSSFITQAEENPSHYGKHGLDALMAAFHGNLVVIKTGDPTSFRGWEVYNQLIDKDQQ